MRATARGRPPQLAAISYRGAVGRCAGRWPTVDAVVGTVVVATPSTRFSAGALRWRAAAAAARRRAQMAAPCRRRCCSSCSCSCCCSCSCWRWRWRCADRIPRAVLPAFHSLAPREQHTARSLHNLMSARCRGVLSQSEVFRGKWIVKVSPRELTELTGLGQVQAACVNPREASSCQRDLIRGCPSAGSGLAGCDCRLAKSSRPFGPTMGCPICHGLLLVSKCDCKNAQMIAVQNAAVC